MKIYLKTNELPSILNVGEVLFSGTKELQLWNVITKENIAYGQVLLPKFFPAKGTTTSCLKIGEAIFILMKAVS